MPWDALIKSFSRYAQRTYVERLLAGCLLLLQLYLFRGQRNPVVKQEQLRQWFERYTSRDALNPRAGVTLLAVIVLAYLLGLVCERVGLALLQATLAVKNRLSTLRRHLQWNEPYASWLLRLPFRSTEPHRELRRSQTPRSVWSPRLAFLVRRSPSEGELAEATWEGLARAHTEARVREVLRRLPYDINFGDPDLRLLTTTYPFTSTWLRRHAPDLAAPSYTSVLGLALLPVALLAPSAVEEALYPGLWRTGLTLLAWVCVAYVLGRPAVLTSSLYLKQSKVSFHNWFLGQLLEDARPSGSLAAAPARPDPKSAGEPPG